MKEMFLRRPRNSLASLANQGDANAKKLESFTTLSGFSLGALHGGGYNRSAGNNSNYTGRKVRENISFLNPMDDPMPVIAEDDISTDKYRRHRVVYNDLLEHNSCEPLSSNDLMRLRLKKAELQDFCRLCVFHTLFSFEGPKAAER